MEYINVPLYVARSSEYVGAEPVQRATWFSLMAWSCDQENMGRITGARYWGDRRWMQTCGVMASEVAESCGLFHWDGDDLIVTFYPEDAQREIERKREIARVNGRKGGRKPTSEPIPETNVGSDIGNHPRRANAAPPESEKKGKEKERKEREVEENNPSPSIPPPCTVEEVEAHLRSAAFAGRVRLVPDQIPDCATAYLAKRDLTDWKRGEIPITAVKWKSDAINFAVSYASNHPLPPGNRDRDPFPDSADLGKQF